MTGTLLAKHMRGKKGVPPMVYVNLGELPLLETLRGAGFCLRFRAVGKGGWTLMEDGSKKTQPFGAGDFTLYFPPSSLNLLEAIIDPDPGPIPPTRREKNISD